MFLTLQRYALEIRGICSLLIRIGKKMKQNAEDIEALSFRMNNLIVMLESVPPAKTRPKEVTERFEKLGRCVLMAVRG
jgi:hypothetical protein